MISHKYLDDLEAEVVNMRVEEIRVGTLFLGNPKAPTGKLPMYSAAMGEGLWIRTTHGVAGFRDGCGYDGQGEMHGWVVEGFIQIDTNLLRVLVRLKKQTVELRLYSGELRKRLAKLQAAIA